MYDKAEKTTAIMKRRLICGCIGRNRETQSTRKTDEPAASRDTQIFKRTWCRAG